MEVASGWVLRCLECGEVFESDPIGYACSRCGGLLEAVRWAERKGGSGRGGGAQAPIISKGELFGRPAEGIWRFRALFPIEARVLLHPISLMEGGTPLVRAVNVPKDVGVKNLYVKNEGQNPTGSFKDRGMTVAVTRAVAAGAKVLICASTGNTSASMAAYAARAGVKAAIIVPAGKVATGKLVQATAYGATIVRSEGTFDDALSLLRGSISKLPGFSVMNSINPYRIEGQKSLAFEIYEQLKFAVPDYVFLPVGNAGNISAIWKGFRELRESGIADKLPRMVGVQAEGASPIARAFWKGSETVVPVDEPITVASAIRIGRPASGKRALSALKESNGMMLTVSDREIVQARRMLAAKEGIFVEPASAAPIAALREIGRKLEKDALVVCVATGNGLKDQESIETDTGDGTPAVPDEASLVERLGLIG